MSYALTPQGLRDLQRELEQLEGSAKKAAIERLKRAREMGSLDDNPEYEAARDDLARIEGRIFEVEEILAQAKVVEKRKGHKKKEQAVQLGSQVVVQIDGQEDTFTLVSSVEADPSNRKISDQSPVGRALLGARKGDLVRVDLGHSVLEYKVIRVK